MDFTSATYTQLLEALQAKGYAFRTVANFVRSPEEKDIIIVRHDVDRLPGNALEMAKLEHGMGVVATYYFRAVPQSWDEDVMKEITSLGHEIGYHYENLTTCGGDFRLAIDDFRLNLEKLRKIYPVKTICMHGSPLSKWDNRDLWEKYDYRDFGIIGDPYFDVDFNEVFYLTDTGRRWDGEKVSVRDKVRRYERPTSNIEHPTSNKKQKKMKQRPECEKVKRQKSVFNGLQFHSTFEIIEAVDAGTFPDRVMMTVHPQRWHDRPLPWAKELIWQNIKNVVKKAMVHRLGR
jgi:hypothetical protein